MDPAPPPPDLSTETGDMYSLLQNKKGKLIFRGPTEEEATTSSLPESSTVVLFRGTYLFLWVSIRVSQNLRAQTRFSPELPNCPASWNKVIENKTR